MDTFELAIEQNGTTRHYPCTVQQFQYSYRFTIMIEQLEVLFEPDEENQLRARTADNTPLSNSTKDQVVLIANELQRILDDL